MSADGRERGLRTALELFGRDGATGTTLSAPRAASGVSVGSFHHHFSGEERVADALFAECAELGVPLIYNVKVSAGASDRTAAPAEPAPRK